jgi:hypothetical protein
LTQLTSAFAKPLVHLGERKLRFLCRVWTGNDPDRFHFYE